MSHHHLRKEKVCANCGHEVTERYCPACGQENVETRQSFGHLVRHFIEDLTHYDGGFWRTMKYLVARPGYLTREFLAGKRNSFVPPVRLYIFVSFVTFLLPHFLPEGQGEAPSKIQVASVDSAARHDVPGTNTIHAGAADTAHIRRLNHLAATDDQLDSLYAAGKLSYAGRAFYHFRHKIRSKLDGDEQEGEKLGEAANSAFPKALFLYMPFFAFIIWLFHGKKRWLYFDHAIFTLHYFSFLMLAFTIMNLLSVPIDLWTHGNTTSRLTGLLVLSILSWGIYYFFRGHHKLYREHTFVSALKAWMIFIINSIAFVFLLAGIVIYAVFTMH